MVFDGTYFLGTVVAVVEGGVYVRVCNPYRRELILDYLTGAELTVPYPLTLVCPD